MTTRPMNNLLRICSHSSGGFWLDVGLKANLGDLCASLRVALPNFAGYPHNFGMQPNLVDRFIVLLRVDPPS